jgi:hypothetical protein
MRLLPSPLWVGQVRPLLAMVTGEESNPLMLMMVKMKVRSMLDSAVPKAKASLYAIAMAKVVVVVVVVVECGSGWVERWI